MEKLNSFWKKVHFQVLCFAVWLCDVGIGVCSPQPFRVAYAEARRKTQELIKSVQAEASAPDKEEYLTELNEID